MPEKRRAPWARRRLGKQPVPTGAERFAGSLPSARERRYAEAYNMYLTGRDEWTSPPNPRYHLFRITLSRAHDIRNELRKEWGLYG